MKIQSLKSVLVCFVAFSIFFLALPLLAQNSALKVNCVDTSGSPVSSAKIVVFCLNNQKAKDKKSDAKGVAEFTKLDDGVYRIIGRKEGFAPAFYDYALLQGSSETVTLKLAAGADKQLYFEDPTQEKIAQGLLKEGFDYYKQKKLQEAEKLFGQSLEIDPSSPEALYYYAVSCLQLSKFEQTVESLNRAAKISDALKTLPAITEQERNSYEQISQGARQLLKNMTAIKGDQALKQQKYDEAIAAYSEAIKEDPNNHEYYSGLAAALAYAKRFDEALAAVDKANQLKPGAYTDLKNQISIRKENAEIDRAQAILNEGSELLRNGDAAGALKKFQEAKGMVAEARQSPIWGQIARAHAKLNQQDEAVAAFRKSIELAPAEKAEDFRKSFAAYYMDAKKYDEALDVLTDPKATASANLEQTLLALAKSSKEIALSEAALERVIKINPGNADAYYELGRLYFADGKEKDSRSKELLTKYVEIGKDQAKIDDAKGLLVVIGRRTK